MLGAPNGGSGVAATARSTLQSVSAALGVRNRQERPSRGTASGACHARAQMTRRPTACLSAAARWPTAPEPARGAAALPLADLAEGGNRGNGEAFDAAQVQPAPGNGPARAQTEVAAASAGHVRLMR